MEGIKDEKDKLFYEIDWEFIEGMAQRMALNKRDKYPVFNWKNEIDVEKLKQAMTRHFIEIQKGNVDDEQTYGHLYALAINSMLIIYQLKNYKNE